MHYLIKYLNALLNSYPFLLFLFVRAVFSQPIQPLQMLSADVDRFLLSREATPFFHSHFLSTDGVKSVQLSAAFHTDPILDYRQKPEAIKASGWNNEFLLKYRMLPQIIIYGGRREFSQTSHITLDTSDNISMSYRRVDYPMGLTIKPEPFGLGKIKYFMHMQGEIWDNRAREYEISLNFGHLSLYRAELRYRRQRLRENISAWVKYLEELNPVECVYQTQLSSWEGYYELNLKHFKVSSTLTLKYSKPKPLRPGYWLGDSSFSYSGGIRYDHKTGFLKGLFLFVQAGQDDVETEGLGYPEDPARKLNRFHFGIAEAYWNRTCLGKTWDFANKKSLKHTLKADGLFQYYQVNTGPVEDPHTGNHESFNYRGFNGDWFENSIWGYMADRTELFNAGGSLYNGQASFSYTMDHKRFSLHARLPFSYSRVEGEFEDITEEGTRFSRDTLYNIGYDLKGGLLFLSPGIKARYELWKIFLSAAVSYAIPLYTDLQVTSYDAASGTSPQEASLKAKGDFDPLKNGLLAGAGVSLGF